MDKKIKDGMVAVLYSPGFGAGWSTWNPDLPQLLFDPVIVQMVEDRVTDETIELYCKSVYGDKYFGGSEDLAIEWVPQGTEFVVHEYDGGETIVLKNTMKWITA